MSEYTKLFERAAARYEPPDLRMEDLLKRQDRKRRNQRIRAGVLGIAIAIAVGWLGFNAIRSTPSVPADDSTPTEGLGIFAPVAGRIVFTDSGLWGVDPSEPPVRRWCARCRGRPAPRLVQRRHRAPAPA